MVDIRRITENKRKQQIARNILEALPEWFGIEEAREEYIAHSAEQLFIAAVDGAKSLGFLSLKQTGKDTVEVYVMGVIKERHRNGIGRLLIDEAKRCALAAGYSFLQVKTVQMGRYAEYDATNKFYLSLGFKEFEVFPGLWDECNPCQIYVMAL